MKAILMLEPEFKTKDKRRHARMLKEMVTQLENRGASVESTPAGTKITATWETDDNPEYHARAATIFFMNHVGGPIGIKAWKLALK